MVATSSSGIRNLGKLRVMHLPSPAELEQAESKRRQATAAPHRNAQPTVDLKVYVHEAHTQKILATAHLVGASSSGNHCIYTTAVLSMLASTTILMYCRRCRRQHQHSIFQAADGSQALSCSCLPVPGAPVSELKVFNLLLL